MKTQRFVYAVETRLTAVPPSGILTIVPHIAATHAGSDPAHPGSYFARVNHDIALSGPGSHAGHPTRSSHLPRRIAAGGDTDQASGGCMNWYAEWNRPCDGATGSQQTILLAPED